MESYYFLISFIILVYAGLFMIFQKAGEQPWKALIPVYNFYIWLKILQKPWWWIFIMIIPGVGFLMIMILSYSTAKAFRKNNTIELIIAALFPFIYLPYLGFVSKTKFMGPEDQSKIKKSIAREWMEALVFALVVASIIRTFFIEAFTIPTSSMEKSLMIGDYLFVSKMSYGPKIPNTPLAFPLAHHTLPAPGNIRSYLEWIKLPYFRLPGFGKIKNNDIVVFNYPEGDTVVVQNQNVSYYQMLREIAADARMQELQNNQPLRSYDEYLAIARQYITQNFELTVRPVDKRENYIKRCVAIPGDLLEVRNRELFINGKPAYSPKKMQYSYMVYTDSNLPRKLFEQMDITEAARPLDNGSIEMTLPADKLAEIKKIPGVTKVEPVIDSNLSERTFPQSLHWKGTADFFGPLTVPKKGTTVKLDSVSFPVYQRIIDLYEGNQIEVSNNEYFINGVKSSTYTFKMDYYFMMGDNRHNSADSRYWGFVPEDHVVGKAVFIWMSIKENNPNTKTTTPFIRRFYNSIFEDDFRRARFFTFVHNDGLSRSYLIHFIILVAAIWGILKFRRRKEKTA
jgi:signal peptidase I